jgi:hypothetical protein
MAGFAPKIRQFIYDLFTNLEFRSHVLDSIGLVDSIFSKAGQDTTNVKEAMQQLSEDDKRKMTEKLTEFLAKVGSNTQLATYRQDLLELFDYFREQTDGQGVDPALRKELSDLYSEGLQVLQRFAQNVDIKGTQDKFWALYKDINSDQEAKNYFYELRTWMDHVVQNPTAAHSQETVDKGLKLIEQGKTIVTDKYGDKIRDVLREIKADVQALGQDRYAQEMKENLKDVRSAISGSVVGTLGQLRHIALPLFKEFVAELPLPPISETTDSSTYTIDHMTLKGKDLGLDDLSINLKLSTKDLVELVVTVKSLNLTISDIHFTYERTSLPKFSDQGICSADISIPRMRLRWHVTEHSAEGRPPRFEFDRVETNFDTVNIRIEEAKHKLLDKIILGFMSNTIKTRAQNSLEENLKKQANTISESFDKVFIQQLTIPPPKSSSDQSSQTTTPTTTATTTPAATALNPPPKYQDSVPARVQEGQTEVSPIH